MFTLQLGAFNFQCVPGYGSTVAIPNISNEVERTITGCPILKGGRIHPPTIVWTIRAKVGWGQFLNLQRIIDRQQELIAQGDPSDAIVVDRTWYWSGAIAGRNGRIIVATVSIPGSGLGVYLQTKGRIILDSFSVLNRHAEVNATITIDLTVQET